MLWFSSLITLAWNWWTSCRRKKIPSSRCKDLFGHCWISSIFCEQVTGRWRRLLFLEKRWMMQNKRLNAALLSNTYELNKQIQCKDFSKMYEYYINVKSVIWDTLVHRLLLIITTALHFKLKRKKSLDVLFIQSWITTER